MKTKTILSVWAMMAVLPLSAETAPAVADSSRVYDLDSPATIKFNRSVRRQSVLAQPA